MSDTEYLDTFINTVLANEAKYGPDTLESVREELNELTYPDVVEYVYSLKEIVLSLAHRVRELEAQQ